MRRLIDRPGFLLAAQGGDELRRLYSAGAADFNFEELSPFGRCCYMGSLDMIKVAVEEGFAPDLSGTETAYNFGYLSFAVWGSKVARMNRAVGPDIDHVGTVRYLIQRGCPTESADIAGHTALMHACINAPILDVARELAAGGANPDHQNKYGAVTLMPACLQNQVDSISILMEHGASLDIPHADGITPRAIYDSCGPAVVAEIQKWLSKRNGEERWLQEKRCDSCGKDGPSVKLRFCARCRLRRYCSEQCQRADWKLHKVACKPFDSASSMVTVKPRYLPDDAYRLSVDPSEQIRARMDDSSLVPVHQLGPRAPRMSDIELNTTPGRNLTIKVQVPLREGGNIEILNRRRDYRCAIAREDDATAYDRLKDVVRAKGRAGPLAHAAYFRAELKSGDELLIQTGEALAAQPF